MSRFGALLAIVLALGRTAASAQTEDRAAHQLGWLTRPDARLEYLDFGRGGSATIVLLPGHGDNAHVYDDLAPLLGRHFRVLALTPRGQGASSTPDSGYTVRSFAEDLRAFLDTLRVRRVILVGHSAAGGIITEFAARYPKRVAALVYLDATMDLARRDSVLAANPVPRPAPTDSTPEGARQWYRTTFYGFWSNAIENSMRSHGTDASARKRPRLLPQFLADLTLRPSKYSAVQAPALIVSALKTVDANYPWLRGAGHEGDRERAQLYLDTALNPWYAAGARRAAHELRRARIVTVPGHHYIFITEQQQVAAAIIQFVRHTHARSSS